MAIEVTVATTGDSAELAEVAAECFPLACPRSVRADDVAAFITANLSTERFEAYLTDPRRRVLAAREDGRIIGYAMLARGASDDDPVELSKMYVLPDHHRGGAAAELMRRGIEWAALCGTAAVWLGVNQHNRRAQRFYRKHGFEVTGTRTFQLGDAVENDFIMRRAL